MSWFKLDTSFYDHPKLIGLTPGAIGLWVKCIAYGNNHLTDGFIPKEIAKQLSSGDGTLVKELVDRGLWNPDGDGWVFHDWHQWNDSRADVQARRRRDAERQRVSYQRRKNLTSEPSKSSRNSPIVHRPEQGRRRRESQVVEPRFSEQTHTPQIEDPKGSLERTGARDGAPPVHSNVAVDREHQAEMARRTLGPLREELAAKRRAKLANNADE